MRRRDEYQHINGKEVDYVLGLLPWHESQSIEQHIKACDQCRMVINREKSVGAVVKQTLIKAGTVNESQLRRQRPLFSKPNLLQKILYRGQRQFLIAGFVIFLVVASVGLQLKLQASSFFPADSAFTSTSTVVADTPTMTTVATEATGSQVEPPQPTPDALDLASLPEVMLAPVAAPPTTFVANRNPN